MAVPDKYVTAVKILNDVKARKRSFKRAMATLKDSLDVKDQKAVYALVSNTLKHRHLIEKMRKVCYKHNNLGHLDETLLEIAIAKIIFERKVSTKSLPCDILEFKVPYDLRKLLKELKSAEVIEKPKLEHVYLRINTLKTNCKEIIRLLGEKGFNEVTMEYNTFEDFINCCYKLNKSQFMKDFHFPKILLVFRSAAVSALLETDLYKEGKFLIQDKASVLAISCLPLEKRMSILDVCSAPGTKTAVIASILKNKATIISIDRDHERMNEMKSLMQKLDVTCTTMIEGDFIDVAKKEADKINFGGDIDLLILDPSCSGSGRPDMVGKNVEASRVGKISGFQIVLLRTALSLRPKSILYSTCSLNTYENERVIDRALKESENGSLYQIEDPYPNWPLRGDNKYPFGTKCIRSDDSLLTRGFFFCYMTLIQDS